MSVPLLAKFNLNINLQHQKSFHKDSKQETIFITACTLVCVCEHIYMHIYVYV